jgi:hypothetical protein
MFELSARFGRAELNFRIIDLNCYSARPNRVWSFLVRDL